MFLTRMNQNNADKSNRFQTLWTRVKSQRQILFLLLVSIAVTYLLKDRVHMSDGHMFVTNDGTSSLPTQEVVIFSNGTSYVDHMQAARKGCADICRIDMPGEASIYHDYIEKQVNCKAILSNPAIDAIMGDPEPPATIPTEMMDAFTYGGKVTLSFYADDNNNKKLFNQRYLGKEVRAVN